jgi:hypothetical protein
MESYNVDGVKIPFDKNWTSICVSLSGGADSALLAYILCTLSTSTTINIISHTRMWKTRPWQQYDSLNVFNYLIDKFPHLQFKRHINFIAPDLEYGNIGPTLTDAYGKKVSGDNIEIRSFAEYVCFNENAEAYYNAVTRNPKNIDLGGMIERDIDPTPDNDRLLLIKHMNRWAIHPFRFTEKSWVIKQYKDLEIEELLNITRSCEGEFENLTYETYTPGQYVPTCGKCFWCKEREWAIEYNK